MPNRKTIKSIGLDDVHWEIIEGLTPFYGTTSTEVARNIILMWLHKNLGSDTIKELQDINAIGLGKVKNEGKKP